MFEKHKMNQRDLAEHFQCGRTQIAQIIKNKESIKSLMNLMPQVARFMLV